MRMMRWMLVVAAAAALVVCGRGALGAERGEKQEWWYTVMMQGQRVGWMREAVAEVDENRVRSEWEMVMRVGRFDQEVEIKMKTAFLETRDGRPIESRMMQLMGLMDVQSRSVFGKDTIVTETTQLGLTNRKTEPMPEGDWLTPLQANEFVRKRLEAGADVIEFSMLDPSVGTTPVRTTMRIGEPVVVQALGKDLEGRRVEIEQSMMAGTVQQSVIDKEGRTLRAEVALGQFEVTMTIATRAEALAELETAELMADTMVRATGRAIRDARGTKRAVYTLRLPGGEMPELVSGGVQRADRLDDSTVRVRVDLGLRQRAPGEDAGNDAYLADTTLADIDDEVIVRMMREAVKGIDAKDARGRAEAIERFVRGHMRRTDLNVAFGSASEVARSGQGDCTEYSVLTVALLRAAGIPARGVTGMVFVEDFGGKEDVFGYHMWAQALVERERGGGYEWVDLDAAIGGMDATHIAMSTTDLSEGLMTEMISMASLFGRLEIEVEEAR